MPLPAYESVYVPFKFIKRFRCRFEASYPGMPLELAEQRYTNDNGFSRWGPFLFGSGAFSRAT